MTTPLCRYTGTGILVIMGLLLLLLPFWPLLVITFEAGLFVGILLHSSHVKEAKERDFIEERKV